MADSNITKKALANALKELMEEMPFKKISVSDICEKCAMNRKSFYYHFRDKYDLVNWIFDTEFFALLQERDPGKRWEFVEKACQYFYDNRSFYCKVLNVRGQDCFSEHFREFMHPLLRERIKEIVGSNSIPDMYVTFFADGIACAFERWLLDKNCMPPDEFIAAIKHLVQLTAICVSRDEELGSEPKGLPLPVQDA